MQPDEGATGAAAVPHVLSASSAIPTGGAAQEIALDMSPGEEVPKDALGAQIEALRKEQQTLKDQKKKLQKDLRNAVRKKKRLCDRARKLSDKDLIAVLMLRKNQRQARVQVSAGDDSVGASRPDVASDASPSSAAP